MDWVSVVLLAGIGLLTWRAYANGFVRESVSLAAVVLAIPIAGIFYDDLYPKVHPIVDSEALARLISFLAIFFAVVIGGQVGSYLMRGVARALNLGSVDRVAGAAFGFAKGVVASQAILLAFVAFPKPDLHDDIDRSPVARALLDAAPSVLVVLPATFDRALDAFLSPARQLDGAIGNEGGAPNGR
jgi:membrane protein required for colicin V production